MPLNKVLPGGVRKYHAEILRQQQLKRIWKRRIKYNRIKANKWIERMAIGKVTPAIIDYN